MNIALKSINSSSVARAALILAFLLLSTTAEAKLSMGLDAYYRSYSESFEPPSKSDEYGSLGGFTVNFSHTTPYSLYIELNSDLSMGLTTYDGSSYDRDTLEFSGFVMSKTFNVFLNMESLFGYQHSINSKTSITPFIGTGVHVWVRDILNSKEVEDQLGYPTSNTVETYAWPYLSTGLRFDKQIDNNLAVGLKVNVMRMSEGTMDAADYHSENVYNLGNKNHVAIELPITYKKFCITPYFKNQNIGESDYIVKQRDDGSYSYSYEPSSKTHVFGARYSYIF